MKPRIFYKLFIFVVLLFFGMSVTFGILFITRMKQVLLSERVLRASALAENLSRNATAGVQTLNVLKSLEPLVASMMRQKDVVYVDILDVEGVSFVSAPSQPIPRPGSKTARPDLGPYLFFTTDISGGEGIEVNYPVLLDRPDTTVPIESLERRRDDPIRQGGAEGSGGQATSQPIQIGLVRLGMSLASFHQEIRNATIFALFLLGGVFLFGTVAVFLFSRRLSSRIERLARAAQQLGEGGEGGVEMRVPLTRHDELGDLTVAFNKMADAIQRSKDDLEARVRERTAELTRSNEDLAQFAYVASHDLREPLRGINTLASWIEEGYAHRLDEEGKSYLSLLRERVQRMDHLILGILDYSRIGRIQQEKTQVDLNLLVREVIDLLAVPSHIEVRIENTLPTVFGDKTQMSQLFQNLLGNAIKFMNKPKGKITISSVAEDAAWKVSVADNGPGIEAKYFEKIFEVFETLTPAGAVRGPGIGLAIVKKIVEMHGGNVGVTSEVGQGSRFTVTFPAEEDPEVTRERAWEMRGERRYWHGEGR